MAPSFCIIFYYIVLVFETSVLINVTGSVLNDKLFYVFYHSSWKAVIILYIMLFTGCAFIFNRIMIPEMHNILHSWKCHLFYLALKNIKDRRAKYLSLFFSFPVCKSSLLRMTENNWCSSNNTQRANFIIMFKIRLGNLTF